jgi:hypothetical protein
MSAASQLVEKLLDVVVETDLQRPDTDFVDGAFAVLALALSRLPASEREANLLAVENGALRKAVEQFQNPYPRPQQEQAVSDGRLH